MNQKRIQDMWTDFGTVLDWEKEVVTPWRESIQDMAAALTTFQDQLATLDNDADFMDAYNDLVSVAGDALDALNVGGYNLDDLRAAVGKRGEVN
jgi:hypothetical protein